MNQPAPRLRDINAQQWRAGLAAWLGWFFDGLDMHLYTLVALPFVAELMHMPAGSAAVHEHASWIMAAFLLGWALGGGFFGMIGDRLGRSRALILTILTYACFTGLSYFAQSWEELALYRFLAALGIGGEWAVGASLLSETWPSAWRTTLAAVLLPGDLALRRGHGPHRDRSCHHWGTLPSLAHHRVAGFPSTALSAACSSPCVEEAVAGLPSARLMGTTG
jgi:hypothetical protein